MTRLKDVSNTSVPSKPLAENPRVPENAGLSGPSILALLNYRWEDRGSERRGTW